MIRRGLARFLQESPAATDEELVASGKTKDELLAHVEAGIANYQRAESKQVLTQLLSMEYDDRSRLLLAKIGTAIDELNFEEAEEILQKFRMLVRKEGDSL